MSKFHFRPKISKCLNSNYSCNDHISISSVFPQLKLTSFHVSFLSRVKMNSRNWSALNIWVFIAQLEEHCSANVKAIGSNPVKALKIFSAKILQLFKFRLQLRWSHLNFIRFPAVQINFISRKVALVIKQNFKANNPDTATFNF